MQCFWLKNHQKQSPDVNDSIEELVEVRHQIVMTHIVQQPLQASAQESSDDAAQEPPEDAGHRTQE